MTNVAIVVQLLAPEMMSIGVATAALRGQPDMAGATCLETLNVTFGTTYL